MRRVFMEDIKYRAQLLKQICKGEKVKQNMCHLLNIIELPEYVLDFYLKLGRFNSRDSSIDDWWYLIIVQVHDENYDKCGEWLESLGFYSDGGTGYKPEHGKAIMDIWVDIERSYIKHLELIIESQSKEEE